MKIISKENKKFLIETLCGILFACLVVGLLIRVFYEYYNLVIYNQKEQLLLIAREVSKEIEREVEGTEEDLAFLIEEIGGQPEEVFATYQKTHNTYISNLIYTKDSLTTPLHALKEKEYELISIVSKSEEKEYSLWKEDSGKIYLAIAKKDMKENFYIIMLNLEKIYEKKIADIQLGEKGYIMVKDENATIIMHNQQEQLGINALTDRTKIYPKLNLDESDVVALIQKQMTGVEGVQLYKSYWWGDKEPTLIKKISAFTPATVGDGFFIVSAVNSFSELYGPLLKGMITLIFLCVFIGAGIFIAFRKIKRLVENREKIKMENKTLKELNATLQTLHENEQIIAHQQRLQIIGTMTGGISHEFNNLLTPIMGYSGLLLNTMEKENPYYEEVEEIYDAAEKAKDIIQQISSLSRRNTDTVFKYCKIKELLKRISKMVESIRPSNVTVELITSEFDDGILGNVTQINQVILNLIVNAFHAIGEKQGIIQIGYERVSSSECKAYLSHGAGVRDKNMYHEQEIGQIYIKDNGCGMEQQVLEKIFDPFFTTKSSIGGTGLGLAIVENIIENHSGQVIVESKLGEGTIFRILLPVAQAIGKEESADGTMRKKERSQLNKGRILVLDDNPKVLKYLHKGLKIQEFDVITETSVHQAQERLCKEEYDILILEDSLKEMSGIRLATTIRMKNTSLYILIITGMLRKEVVEAKQSGIINDYMMKPIAISPLIEYINNILEKP